MSVLSECDFCDAGVLPNHFKAPGTLSKDTYDLFLRRRKRKEQLRESLQKHSLGVAYT